MTTLPNETWQAHFESKEHYLQLRQRWSWLHNSPDAPKLKSAHYLFYALLRGRDWRKGFTMFTNEVKRANGYWGAWGANVATTELKCMSVRARTGDFLAPFNGLVTLSMLKLVRDAYLSKSSYFLAGLPEEAYPDPDPVEEVDRAS
jgi:hypothetical protein